MAQLVFVHGVATRSGSALDITESNTNRLFASSVFEGAPFEFYTPRWGDLVPAVPESIYATNAAQDSFAVVSKADDDSMGLGGQGADGSGSISIGEVATHRPILAIDAVLAALVDETAAKSRPLTDDEIASFVSAVNTVADENKVAKVAREAGNDADLTKVLAPDDDSYALNLGPIGRAVENVTGRIRNLTSGFAWNLVRDSIRPAVGLFSGDVFAYLNNGDLRGKIQQVVGGAIDAAWKARASNEPLILVGHSLGGVILTDMLSDPAATGLPTDLTVDCLFTVGSQPGLFQAVGALGGGAPASGKKLPRRERIGHWFNVFDPIDPLAFAAAPIFDGVEDVVFDSITGVASAHTTYFTRPQFYARFRARLDELNLVR